MSRMTNAQADKMENVLDEVWHERHRQHEKWGEQDHPDGTGYYTFADDGSEHAMAYTRSEDFKAQTDDARAECDNAFKQGTGTYRHILAEEVAEAFAESDDARLRKELVQIGAVVCQWIEAIDRRSKAKP